MSIESRSRQYGKVFDHWQIREFLGSGSGGKSAVFRLVHTDSSSVQSVLKVISLIEKRGIFENLPESRKKDYEETKQKCKRYAEQEVLRMNDLQGRTNIVDYLDHTFVEWIDGNSFGYDMLIRMEFLKDLRNEIESERFFSQDDIIKIGKDICTALVLCHRKGILHRDIKPENIFFNSDGNYKLGDFGISRILSAAPMSKASTGIGTPEYAAPEQISGEYDMRVDIYSLGLVLYELSNKNRLPFANSSYVTDVEIQKRMFGEPLPMPCNATKDFASIIQKACAFSPDDRYQTATEFLAELDKLSSKNHRFTKKEHSVSNNTQKAVPPARSNETQYASSSVPSRINERDTMYAGVQVTYSQSGQISKKGKAKFRNTALIAIPLILGISGAVACGINLNKGQNQTLQAPSENSSAANETDTQRTALLDATLSESALLADSVGDDTIPPATTPATTPVTVPPVTVPPATASPTIDQPTTTAPTLPEPTQAPTETTPVSNQQTSKNELGMLAAGNYHSVRLYPDGTVRAVGRSSLGKSSNKGTRLDVSTWTDIVAVAASSHTVGIKADGTVVACGVNGDGQCNLENWTDITAIAVGDNHTVGLRKDGTVVAKGANQFGQCNVSQWHDIIAVAASKSTTYGLTSKGQVLSAGECSYGSNWSDVVSICGGTYELVGLKADGTVVASGASDHWSNSNTVPTWKNITAISASSTHIVGLKADGTVVACGMDTAHESEDVTAWTDVVQISAGMGYIIGLRSDGTVVSTGSNAFHQREI